MNYLIRKIENNFWLICPRGKRAIPFLLRYLIYKGSDEMGSVKCTLRKEVKNDINKYIDTEFINEAIKEITVYIKTINKVQIDDSEFDENDINSRVILKDDGKFNIYDYTYVKDFIYELSWEGSYVEEVEEDSFDDKKIYKYVPKDIATVIYEKV